MSRLRLPEGPDLRYLLERRRFRKLARDTRGMMHPKVYWRLHHGVRAMPEGDVIEVGGAGGASGVAVAWALQQRGRGEKVVVVEKCEGGSRSRRGSYGDNLSFLESSFRVNGVEDQVTLYPHALTHGNGGEVLGMVGSRPVAALIHDADGRLDRDFFLFWPALCEGGLIVIDDYGPELERKERAGGRVEYVSKRLLTFALLNKLKDWGLFEERYREGSTVFGAKPEGAEFSRFDQAACEQVVKHVKGLTDSMNGKPAAGE